MNARLAAALVAGAVALSAPPARAGAYPFVAVPQRDVHDPARGSLHDYGTKSPDSWDRADFRGPCAGHDLCSMDHTAGKEACDRGVRRHMEINCRFAFDQDGGAKDPDKFRTCLRIAAVYDARVRRVGHY